MEETKINKEHESYRDPDPVTVILATLSAIGSIASIASLVKQNNASREMNSYFARESRSEIVEHLASAEAALIELVSVISRVRIAAQISRSQSLLSDDSRSETGGGLEFGRHGLLLPDVTLKQFLKLQDLAFRRARELQKHLSGAVSSPVKHTVLK